MGYPYYPTVAAERVKETTKPVRVLDLTIKLDDDPDFAAIFSKAQALGEVLQASIGPNYGYPF